MGTSSSHRSPSTPEWERVRELYRERDVPPGLIAASIVSALEPETKREMAGPGVACCLSSLLYGARVADLEGLLPIWEAHPRAQGPALLRLAQALREEAEQQIAGHGFASRFADLGLNALGTATLEAGAGGAAEVFNIPAAEVGENLAVYPRQRRLADLSLCYLAHDFDHLFRYFVTRDLSDFIGSEALPSVSDGSRLRDAVTQYCRRAVARVEAAGLEGPLTVASAARGEEDLRQVQAALGGLVQLGLEQVTSGG